MLRIVEDICYRNLTAKINIWALQLACYSGMQIFLEELPVDIQN